MVYGVEREGRENCTIKKSQDFFAKFLGARNLIGT